MSGGRILFLSSSLAVFGLAAAGIWGRAFPACPIVVALLAHLALVLAGVMIPRLSMFAPIVCQASGARREVALTFDDGPNPESTRKVLAELARHKAHATFFILGAKAQEHPDVLRDIQSAGHEIGLHGYLHDRLLSFRRPDRIVADLERAQSIIKATTGQTSRLFRPPVGHVSPRTAVAARRLGLVLVGWSVRARDGLASTSAGNVVRRVVDRLAPGAIVLFHDASERDTHEPAGVTALPRILDEIASRGLACVTVSEALSPQPHP
jgi:peptidoglycan-N-acetylglucosamine deacetylase